MFIDTLFNTSTNTLSNTWQVNKEGVVVIVGGRRRKKEGVRGKRERERRKNPGHRQKVKYNTKS